MNWTRTRWWTISTMTSKLTSQHPSICLYINLYFRRLPETTRFSVVCCINGRSEERPQPRRSGITSAIKSRMVLQMFVHQSNETYKYLFFCYKSVVFSLSSLNSPERKTVVEGRQEEHYGCIHICLLKLTDCKIELDCSDVQVIRDMFSC